MPSPGRIALAALVVMAACSDGDEAALSTMTVDTLPGGAVLVTNTPPAAATHTLEEELRIGDADGSGATLFGEIKGLAIDDAGRIAVLEAQAQEVRMFGPDGTHQVTHGKKGGGPGEFQAAFGIMQSSDGMLYVPDQANRRVNVLHPDSGFLRSHPVQFTRLTYIWEGAMRADDHVLLPAATIETRRDILRIYAPDMTQVDSVFMPQTVNIRPGAPGEDVPGGFAWKGADGRSYGLAPIPFYPIGLRRLTSTGDFWSTANSDASYRVARWTPDGDTTLILQTEHAPIPVTTAERDSAMQAVTEQLSGFGVTGLDASKVPAVKAAVVALFTDDRDRLWVQVASPDSLVRYDVYEPDGRLVQTIATTLNVYPYFRPVVRGDNFYAVVRDEVDVPYVVRARIVPAGEVARD